jgi:superfamily I DNA and/or RNA helicase
MLAHPAQVEMCVSMVRYLLQQGYTPDQITVLTPYLGQLVEVHRELRDQDLEVMVMKDAGA